MRLLPRQQLDKAFAALPKTCWDTLVANKIKMIGDHMNRVVEVFALIMWDKSDGSIITIEPLNGDNGPVCITYPNYIIGSLDNLHQAIKGFSPETRKAFYFAYSEGHDITLEGEAMNMPSIGGSLITVESQQVRWDVEMPEQAKPDRYVVLPCVGYSREETLHEIVQRAVNPVTPERSIRRPTDEEVPDYWAVYFKEDDDTSTWVQDYANKQDAEDGAEAMNGQ